MTNINTPEVDNWRQIEPLQLTPKEIYESILEDDDKFDGSEEICIIFKKRSNSTLVDLLYDGYSLVPGTNSGVHNPSVRGKKRQDRFDVLRTCLCIIAFEYNKGFSDKTIKDRVIAIKKFITFTGYMPKALESVRISLNDYIEYYFEQIRAYTPANKDTGQLLVGISSKEAKRYQGAAILFIKHHFEVKKVTKITAGINLITTKNVDKLANKTQALSKQEQAREFSYYTLLFRRLTDIVLNHEILPQKVDFVDGHVWVAASNAIQIQTMEPDLNGIGFKRFNFTDGTYYTPWALETACGKTLNRMAIYDLKRDSLQSYLSANEENSLCRIRLALLAMKAYFMHSLFVTGMNDSILKELPYSSDYTVTKKEINFCTIKWRANKRKISFNIQSEFIGDFKRFLELREYLLSLSGFESYLSLFFKFKANTYIPNDLYPKGSANAYCREVFKNKCPFKLKTSQEIRVTKGLWIRKKYGPLISAWILQHSIDTELTDYSGNNNETTKDELTSYYDALNKKVFTGSVNDVSTPSGKCSIPPDPNNLKATGNFIDGTPEALKNCDKFEGCLFCHNLRLIGDETDTRKLFSLKYVTEQCRPLAKNNAHFERVHQATIDRIDSLFKELINLNPEKEIMVQEIEESVYKNELLSDFWNKKLEFLFDLGIL